MKCICGAEKQRNYGWECGTVPSLQDPSKILYSQKCLETQARRLTERVSALAEFRRAVESADLSIDDDEAFRDHVHALIAAFPEDL